MTPRASADLIDGVVGGALKVRVTAAPVDGAANESLVRLIADSLRVPRGHVRLVTGAANRRKLIEVQGIDAAVLRARWPDLDV